MGDMVVLGAAVGGAIAARGIKAQLRGQHSPGGLQPAGRVQREEEQPSPDDDFFAADLISRSMKSKNLNQTSIFRRKLSQ